MAVLTNSDCAAAVGGPTAAGQAAAAGAIAGQLFGNPNKGIQFDPTPDPGIGGYAQTDVSPVTGTVTVALGADFYDPMAQLADPTNPGASLTFAQNQELTILHEYGHAMEGLNVINGTQYVAAPATSMVSPDNPQFYPGVSNANDWTINDSCLQGGNVQTTTSEVDMTIE